MKIAILHSGDLEHVSMGGVDRYIKSLIEFFDDNEITVFGTGKYGCFEIGKEYNRLYHDKKYTFIPISDDRKRPLSVYYMIKELRLLKKLKQYDCIYAQRTEYSIPFVFSKNGRKKLIQIIHGSSKYSEVGFGHKMAKIHIFLEAIAISIARKTFIILNREEFGVPYYKKRYHKYADRIYYAKNPINPAIFHHESHLECKKNLEIYDKGPIIVFTGRVEHNPKRVLLFPDICKALNTKGVFATFVIVGDGSDKEKLVEKVYKYNLSNQFKFVGYVEDSKQIAQYYNAADVAINISMFEGTCTSNLEAIATGTPVVSTDVGDINEVLDGTHNGVIIPNVEEEQLIDLAAEALVTVFNGEVSMNDSYKKYSGTEVVKELRKEMSV